MSSPRTGPINECRMRPALCGAVIIRARLALVLALAAAPLTAEAQPAKIPRIGYLAGASLSASPHVKEAFRQGLRDLGYAEGRDVVIEYRGDERPERFPALAAELVALKVDVIVAPTTLAAVAAKQATQTLPIVFATAGDPVGLTISSSLLQQADQVIE
jgi:putative ABC transport system substrate-binding protein